MGYNSHSSSVLKFTIDGRPTIEDIHYLFSLLVIQVPVSTHKHMFRAYENTFISEDALNTLVSHMFSKLYESSGLHLSTSGSYRTLKLNRDMAKALIQQFIWTRLIENAHESYNRNYKDKGIWRLTSKGLCVVQEFCAGTNSDATKFSKLVNASSRLMFLYQIERLHENDRMNCKNKYISSLFAIMIASLPLRQNINNDVKISHPMTARLDMDDSYSISSADSYSTYSSSNGSRGLSFTDYFPFIKILPNDVILNSNPKNIHQFNQKTCFQQQKILLHNLCPSSNKFKMRAIFSSMLCCNWLIEFCTVASMDEAESIMMEFVKLGWVTFYDEKYKQCTQIDSSKSIALNLTRSGMQVVMNVSLEKHNNVKQLNQPQHYDESEVGKKISRSSFTSSMTTGNQSDILIPTNLSFNEKDVLKRTGHVTKLSSLPLLQTASFRTTSTSSTSSTATTPVLEKSSQSFGVTYFDMALQDETPASPFVNTKAFDTTLSANNTTFSQVNDISSYKESNTLKLRTILKNEQLQLLFRDFLSDNFCVENFDFWKDHDKLLRNCRRQKANGTANYRQLLEDAYIIWDIYLKPGTLRELNVDHTLREEMAEDISEMVTLVPTYTSGKSKPSLVISTQTPSQSLTIVLNWLEKVNDRICNLMATDSIPRFIRTAEYKALITNQLPEEEGVKTRHMYKQDSRPKCDSIRSKSTIFTNDLDDFPPPPQRMTKETIYL